MELLTETKKDVRKKLERVSDCFLCFLLDRIAGMLYYRNDSKHYESVFKFSLRMYEAVSNIWVADWQHSLIRSNLAAAKY